MAEPTAPEDYEGFLRDFGGCGTDSTLARAARWAVAEIDRLRAEVKRLKPPPKLIPTCPVCGAADNPTRQADGTSWCNGCGRYWPYGVESKVFAYWPPGP